MVKKIGPSIGGASKFDSTKKYLLTLAEITARKLSGYK